MRLQLSSLCWTHYVLYCLLVRGSFCQVFFIKRFSLTNTQFLIQPFSFLWSWRLQPTEELPFPPLYTKWTRFWEFFAAVFLEGHAANFFLEEGPTCMNCLTNFSGCVLYPKKKPNKQKKKNTLMMTNSHFWWKSFKMRIFNRVGKNKLNKSFLNF